VHARFPRGQSRRNRPLSLAQARFLTLISAGIAAASGSGNRSTFDGASTTRVLSQSTGSRTDTLVPDPTRLRIASSPP